LAVLLVISLYMIFGYILPVGMTAVTHIPYAKTADVPVFGLCSLPARGWKNSTHPVQLGNQPQTDHEPCNFKI